MNDGVVMIGGGRDPHDDRAAVGILLWLTRGSMRHGCMGRRMDRGGEGRGAGEAVFGTFRHRAPYHLVERARRGHGNLRWRRRFGIQRLMHDRGHAAIERPLTGQQLIQQHSG